MATSAQIRKFIAQISPIAAQVGAEYGVDPSVIAAQAALESGFGTATPGNEYFGVKGPGQTIATKEQSANGLYSTSDSFRSYPSLLAAARDYARLVSTRYPGVAGAAPHDAFAALQADPSHRYATDKNYVSKLKASLRVLNSNGFDPNAPIPPADIPGDNATGAPTYNGPPISLPFDPMPSVPLAGTPPAGTPMPSALTDAYLTGDAGLGYLPPQQPAGPPPNLGDILAFNPITPPNGTLQLGSNNVNYPRPDAGYDLSTLTPDSGALSVLSRNISGSPDDRDFHPPQLPTVSSDATGFPTSFPTIANDGPGFAEPSAPGAIYTGQGIAGTVQLPPGVRPNVTIPGEAPSAPPLAPGYNALPEDLRNALLASPPPSLPPVPQQDPRTIAPIPLDPPAGYGAAPEPPEPKTVTINGNKYVVGNHYQLANGATFVANANGTLSKLSNPIGNPTMLQLAIASQAPGAMANLNNSVTAAKNVGASALGAVGNLFGGLFGGSHAQAAQPPASGNNGGWGSYTAPQAPQAPQQTTPPQKASGNGGWDAFNIAPPPARSNAAPSLANVPANDPTGGWGAYTMPSAPRAAPPPQTIAAPANSFDIPSSAELYKAPASVNIPKYITISKKVAVPFDQPDATGEGVHWDAALGNYTLDAPAAPKVTYKTIQQQVLNPKYIAPTPPKIVPPPVVAPPVQTNPLNSILNGLRNTFAAPAPPVITGPAMPSTNGYLYARDASGGYSQVGKVNPNLTPSQQYAQAAQAAGGVAQGYAPAGSNNSHGYSGFGSGI